MDTISPAPQGRALPLVFSASGSEYFRIWIVNLLLIVVTLGFYMPFAKARRLRYFYANTNVDGQPLAFHGDAWKMLRGYVLMLLLFGGYALSGHVSGWATLAAFLILAALWPALWRSSLKFRLGNTSWRGLRFGFEGSMADAYKAMLPLFVPGLIFVAATAWALDGVAKDDEIAMAAAMASTLPWMGLGGLLTLLLFPLAFWLIKRYQHSGYRYANQATRFEAGVGSFYKLGLKALGVSLLALLAFGAMVTLLTMGNSFLFGEGPMRSLGALSTGLSFVIGYVAVLSLIGAYFAARLQNLVWNSTHSQALHFDSQLHVTPLTVLTMKNLAFTVLTLGLYRPFAVVNTMALRLSAVQLRSDEAPEQWRAGSHGGQGSAAGEMSGDFFGIDLGL